MARWEIRRRPCRHPARWRPYQRCLACGHRTRGATDDGRPEQTRDLPAWWWPFELSHRLEAWMLGRHRDVAERLGILHDE